MNGIWLSMTTGKQLGTISKGDNDILEHLYSKLKQYPNDELYQFVELTEEDQKNFEGLRETLRGVGLGLNRSISTDLNSFIKQAEKLNETITYPLN